MQLVVITAETEVTEVGEIRTDATTTEQTADTKYIFANTLLTLCRRERTLATNSDNLADQILAMKRRSSRSNDNVPQTNGVSNRNPKLTHYSPT